MTKTLIAAVLAFTALLPAPDASASPDCHHPSACQPGPYPGPLLPVWETFPFGGDSGAVQCNTVTAACGPIAVDPNGRR